MDMMNELGEWVIQVVEETVNFLLETKVLWLRLDTKIFLNFLIF
jgi:hypothetical protein